ncbi:MAG: prepilin-type N-terminal cleavage/methylation domain-containing protein, partial [bacterium]
MNNKGFTLIESIIVVIIISLICALVLPNSG